MIVFLHLLLCPLKVIIFNIYVDQQDTQSFLMSEFIQHVC